MMQGLKSQKKFIFSLALIIFSLPVFFASAQQSRGYPHGTYVENSRFVRCEGAQCSFQDVYYLIKQVIDFLLIDLLSPVAIIAIMFAGLKYVTAQGNVAEIKKAHDIFYYVVIGMLIAFAAWLIVNTILTTLTGGPGSDYNFLSNG